jgi:hypothetical protein
MTFLDHDAASIAGISAANGGGRRIAQDLAFTLRPDDDELPPQPHLRAQSIGWSWIRIPHGPNAPFATARPDTA